MKKRDALAAGTAAAGLDAAVKECLQETSAIGGWKGTYSLSNLPRTPVSALRAMRRLARDEGVNFAYSGNAPGEEGESAFCPGCGKRVIGRYGYFIFEKNVTQDGRCKGCGRGIPGVW